MSNLYLGTDLEELADLLADQLEKSPADFFQPVTIITPHRYLARWLQLRLARQLGAAVNLRVEYLLETVLWELLAELDKREPAQQLRPDDFQLMILAALLEEGRDNDELEDLRSYAKGGKDRGRSYWRRAWQLAGQLSGLLRDYEYHRREKIIGPWEEGRVASLGKNHSFGTLEASQRALFLHALGPEGLIHRLAKPGAPLPRTLRQYAAELRDLGPERLQQLPSGHAVHLFGLGQISKLHVEILHWLGDHYDLRFYHLNPWVSQLPASLGRPPRARAELRKPLQKFAAGQTSGTEGIVDELLQAWGRAGAESLALLAGLLEDDKPFQLKVVSDGTRDKKQTVLCRLQKDLLGDAKTERVKQDPTLQIAACPGIVREVETVHNSIVHNLVQDKSLRLTDIAVLVPDMATYRPALQAVFDRPPRAVPYNLADYSAAELSVFGRAVVDLLDLALESLTRSRVFAVLLNPCCLARLGVDRTQAMEWLAWAENLGVFHGWDPADKQGRGYTASVVFTWQLALRRLRLGRLMDAGDGRASGPAARYRDVIPFANLASGDKAGLDAFTQAVDGLLPRLVELRNWRGNGADWAVRLRQLVDDFLAPPPDRPEESRVRDALFLSLEKLRVFDELSAGRADLPLALVREFVRENLNTLKAMSGDYLIGGVTIAAPQPLLPVPFRIVYVLGMGEGQFPGSDARSPLDLRERERLPGDILPAEGNRFLLLQTLLAAHDRVYLTYDCRDLQKDQEKHPCGPLNQLRRYLEEHVLDKKFAIAELPLSSSDPQLLDLRKIEGPTDVHVCYAEEDRLLAIEQAVASKALSLAAPQEKQRQARLRQALPVFALSGGQPRSADSQTVVSLRELRTFLRCPAEGAVKRYLQLADDEEMELADDEPFITGSSWERRLVVETMERFIRASEAGGVAQALERWPQEFAALHEEWRLRGRAPEGAFGVLDLARLQADVRERLEGESGLAKFLHDRAGAEAVGPLLVGESFISVGARRGFPAVVLETTSIPTGGVRLVGDVKLAWRSDEAVDVLVLTATAAKKVDAGNLSLPLLEPALFFLTLRAGSAQWLGDEKDWLAAKEYRVHVAHAGGITKYSYGADGVSPEQAVDYLTRLCVEYLDAKVFENLPFDLVRADKIFWPAYKMAEEVDQSGQVSFAQKLQEAFEEDQEKLIPEYYAMKLLAVLNLEVPADAFAKVRRRFQLLYRSLAQPQVGNGR